jgi:hypothetical protein
MQKVGSAQVILCRCSKCPKTHETHTPPQIPSKHGSPQVFTSYVVSQRCDSTSNVSIQPLQPSPESHSSPGSPTSARRHLLGCWPSAVTLGSYKLFQSMLIVTAVMV